MNTVTIVHRSRCEPGQYVVWYTLSNGWRITSAQISRYRQGTHRFSIYKPGDAYAGAIGGAETLRECMKEVQRLDPKPQDPSLFPMFPQENDR